MSLIICIFLVVVYYVTFYLWMYRGPRDHTLHNFFGVCGCLGAFPRSVHFFFFFGNGLELKTVHDTVPDRHMHNKE